MLHLMANMLGNDLKFNLAFNLLPICQFFENLHDNSYYRTNRQNWHLTLRKIHNFSNLHMTSRPTGRLHFFPEMLHLMAYKLENDLKFNVTFYFFKYVHFFEK